MGLPIFISLCLENERKWIKIHIHYKGTKRMASGAIDASKLENELVAFVEGHPETFSPQDIINLRRSIIIQCFQIAGTPNSSHPHVIHAVKLIMENIHNKLKVKTINTSQDVKDALRKFELCVECQSIIGNAGGNEMLHPPSPPDYRENLYGLVKRKINEYHAKVLKLWADMLVREGEITPQAINETETVVKTKDGYERKLRELCGNPSGKVFDRGHVKKLENSVLIEFLSLFRVATLAQMTANYGNIGPLDTIVVSIISQFVDNQLNLLRLTCNVVQRPFPVYAYLSSETLDLCTQSIGHFPDENEFAYFEPPFKPLSPSFWVEAPMSTPTSPLTSPPTSTPTSTPTFKGGKKTRRKANKKRKHFNNSRRRIRRR